MQKSIRSEPLYSAVSPGSSATGTGQIALGILVIIMSVFTSRLTVWIVGFGLIFRGIFDLVRFFHKKRGGFFRFRFSLGLLSISGGVILLFYPGSEAALFSFFLAILFILSGIYKAFEALADRPFNWGWLVFGGVLSVILGFFIFSQWPVDSFVILSALLGIEIVLDGWSLMAAGYIGDWAHSIFRVF